FPLLGPTEAGKGVFSRTTFDLPISEVSRPLQILVSIAYSILLYDIYVPDWEYQIAGPGSSSIEKSFSISEMWSERRHRTSLQRYQNGRPYDPRDRPPLQTVSLCTHEGLIWDAMRHRHLSFLLPCHKAQIRNYS
ncbi:hypothetical protein Zm00014a_005030, partial [Zea mays]